jgi:hypothetical protein
MKNHDPKGVWQISEAKTRRAGIGKELFQNFTAPLLDGKVFSYDEGVAELILKTKQHSRGYVFTNDATSEVRFFFDDKIDGCFDILDLPCSFQGSEVLAADDGTNMITLRKISPFVGDLPEDLRQRVGMRQQARAMLESLLKDGKGMGSGTTSSDGKAYLPGVQGK